MTNSLLCMMSLSIGAAPVPPPQERALAFLARESASWPRQNKCFSCHNNGDAARALFAAARLKKPVKAEDLAVNTRWLAKPADWDHNGGEGPFNDKKLARLQFAAALVAAMDAGLITERAPLTKAAEWVAELQDKDGSWQTDADEGIGSPVTHGAALATFMARRTLAHADARRYATAISRADAWSRRKDVRTVVEAAAILLLLDKADDELAQRQRKACIELIRKGESKDGGWGPYVNSPAEVFDTAVVLLALDRQPLTDEMRLWLSRGRKYLVAGQKDDGSWTETTRPSGAVSYAQRISTTGWATLALLATDGSGK